MLQITHQNVDEERMMRLNGIFVPVDPRVWDTSMDMSVNVGLGTGREAEKGCSSTASSATTNDYLQNYT